MLPGSPTAAAVSIVPTRYLRSADRPAGTRPGLRNARCANHPASATPVKRRDQFGLNISTSEPNATSCETVAYFISSSARPDPAEQEGLHAAQEPGWASDHDQADQQEEQVEHERRDVLEPQIAGQEDEVGAQGEPPEPGREAVGSQADP